MKIPTRLLSTIAQTQSACTHIGKCHSSALTSRSFASLTRATAITENYPFDPKRFLPIFSAQKRNLVHTSRYPAVDIPNEDLFSYISANFPFNKSKIVSIDAETGKECTFQQIHEGTLSLGSALIKKGLQPGDVVGICAPNCVEFMMAMIAVPGVGATLCTVNQALTAHEMATQMSMANVKYFITTEELLPVVAEAISGLPGIVQEVFVMGETSDSAASSFAALLTDDGSAFPSEHERRSMIDPASHVAFMPFSSGTTGMPKGVQITHRNIVANIAQLSIPDFLGPIGDGTRDRSLSVLPMWHIYMLMSALVTMRHGLMCSLMTRFEPITFLKAISEHKLGVLPIVPPLVIFLLEYKELVDKYDLSSVREIMSAAAPLGPDTQAQLAERFPDVAVRQGWGMTEIIGATIGPRSEPVIGSCGVLAPNTEMKIVSVDDRSILADGEEGEIAIRGPQVMKGYLNNPKATSETIAEDGWLFTGDIGRVETNGHLKVVDRLKELIKYKGHQVAPAELEDVLLSHPSIADAAVIGIPDAAAGEVPRAFVKLHGGADVEERDIVDFVRGRVGAHSWLRGGAEFVDAIPKAPSGKILRRELREKYKQATATARAQR